MLTEYLTLIEVVGTGTTTVSVVLALWNYTLRSDLRAERKYSQGQEKRNQELNSLYQELAEKNIETNVKMEAAFNARWQNP